MLERRRWRHYLHRLRDWQSGPQFYAWRPELEALGKYRKDSPYLNKGCRCSWCSPETVTRRANEKRKAILDSLDGIDFNIKGW